MRRGANPEEKRKQKSAGGLKESRTVEGAATRRNGKSRKRMGKKEAN